MSELIDSFLDYLRLERAYSPKTIRSYGIDLREFEAYIESVDDTLTLATVDADVVRNWSMELMMNGRKATSVNRKLSALRSFYNYMVQEGKVNISPLQAVTGPKKKKPLPTFLREEEMNKLLDETSFPEGWEGKRDRLVLLMFYETGMRRAELVGMNEGDVDCYRGVLKVTGKRNKQRLIPFGEELKTSLEEYIALKREEEIPCEDDAPLFVLKNGRRVTDQWVYGTVRKYLSLVTTLKKRSPHVLRHTFATAMLNNNAELEAVKELLGHASVSTTQIYTHTTFEELKNVYSTAHPREKKQ